MIVPDRAALAAGQARSQAFARQWLTNDARRLLAARLDATGGNFDRLADACEALLRQPDWLAGLMDPMVAALAADPWFEPPLRISSDRLRTGAMLFDHPHVTFTASVISAAVLGQLPPAPTLVVGGRASVVRYVNGGGATLRRWALAGDSLIEQPPVALADGMVVRIDGRREAILVEEAARDVVMVTALIRVAAAPAMREFDRASGRPGRVASLDDAASRSQMLLTLLRLSGTAGAGACFEAATRDPAHFLRWAAMREWLALDLRAAVPRLEEMAADDPHLEVREAARTTLASAAERLAA